MTHENHSFETARCTRSLETMDGSCRRLVRSPHRLVLVVMGGARLFLAVALAAAFVALPQAADASPWTLDKGRGVVRISTDYQFATKEWLLTGDYQSFPLGGRFFSVNVRAEVRYGITRRLELGGQVAVSHVSYDAREVFFASLDDVDTREQVVSNIISFDSSYTGLGDVLLYARYRLVPRDLWRFTATPELHLKIPTGYRKPQGTFTEDGSLGDDVTLGDGQIDITMRMHFGVIPHPRIFVRGDVGFRLRLFGPGQQVVGGIKFGGRIGAFLIPYFGADAEHTINEGRVIGQSITTSTPEKPEAEFTQADLKSIDYRLDRTAVRPTAGVILSFERFEIDLGYQTVVYGRNVAQLHIINLGASLKW
jgi:hypothetical protein